jgi:small subunit ribosomal protein S4
MGRYTGPTDKLCRREGVNLMLKGARAESGKLERRLGNPPGMHPWRRGRGSEYGKRLREKQKLKRYYGLREGQFRKYFAMANKTRANTGNALLVLLERRLDNVVYKLGFAESRPAARQTVSHGHVYVNGRRCNVSSYLVEEGDVISVKPSEKSKNLIRSRLEELGDPHLQSWLSLDMPKLEARINAMPSPEDVMLPLEMQLILEFCSR